MSQTPRPTLAANAQDRNHDHGEAQPTASRGIDRRRAIACIAALCAAPAARAHGPTPQKVDEQVEIAAPPAAVWALVGDFGAFAAWHPGLTSSSADKGNAVGSARRLVLAEGGGSVTEELDDYDAAQMSLSYRSGRDLDPKVLPVSSYSARLRVTPAGSGSLLEYRARAYRADTGNEPAAGRDDAAAVVGLRKLMRPALEAAKAKLEK